MLGIVSTVFSLQLASQNRLALIMLVVTPEQQPSQARPDANGDRSKLTVSSGWVQFGNRLERLHLTT